MDSVNIAIAVQYQILREGLKTILGAEEEFNCTSTAANLGEIDDMSLEENDVLLLDLELTDLDPVASINSILDEFPEVRILAISDNEKASDIRRIMQTGVSGYMLKKKSADELIRAIKTICEGERYICDEALHQILEYNGEDSEHNKFVDLTDRELQILDLICQELTNREIADQLHISVRTVDAHRQNVLQKTGAKNTAGLVKYAVRHQIYEL